MPPGYPLLYTIYFSCIFQYLEPTLILSTYIPPCFLSTSLKVRENRSSREYQSVKKFKGMSIQEANEFRAIDKNSDSRIKSQENFKVTITISVKL
jgi:hypothetical protein